MEEKRVAPVWVSILLVALAVISIVYAGWWQVANQLPLPAAVSNVFLVVALLCAVIYCFKGFAKSAAIFFKIFCVLFTVAFGLNTYHIAFSLTGQSSVMNAVFVLEMVCFGLMCVFVFALNLGKKKSLALAWIILAATMAIVVLLSIGSVNAIASPLNAFFAAVIFLYITFTKYANKTARGTT